MAGLGRARRALSVTVAQVQSALRQHAALIELLRYRHYLGKDNHEWRYGAIVIGASGEPSWVPLGSAAEIEKSVKLYQNSVRDTDRGNTSAVLKALEETGLEPDRKGSPRRHGNSDRESGRGTKFHVVCYVDNAGRPIYWRKVFYSLCR